jgi:hypothetical protein
MSWPAVCGSSVTASHAKRDLGPCSPRHGFRNPFGEQARVLGIWAPARPAVAFMRDIGAALAPGTPPDPEQMREIYARHASRLLP